MASGPASRIECFNQPLPILDAKTLAFKSVQPSGDSTKQAVPPVILHHVPCKQFLDLANKALQSSKLTNDIPSHGPIATTFPKLPLQSESDVFQASSLYIIHPIMEILHVLYPGKWTIHAELDDKKAPHKLESLEDPGTKQKESAVRYDLIFKSTADPDKTIAVLEYKRRGLIRYNDFELAMVSNNASRKEIERRKEKASAGNLLKTNGISYCKQVCLYAQISECKHVALFNWQHLLLFDFHQLKTIGDISHTAGEEAKISWVHEDPAKGFMERALIRKTLLGWLLKAFNDFESQ